MIKKLIMAVSFTVAASVNAGTLLMGGITAGEDKAFDKQIYDMVYQSHYEPIKKRFGNNFSVYATAIFAYDERQKFCAVSISSVVGTGNNGKIMKIDADAMPSANTIKSSTNVSEYECGALLGKVIFENQRQLLKQTNETFARNML